LAEVNETKELEFVCIEKPGYLEHVVTENVSEVWLAIDQDYAEKDINDDLQVPAGVTIH
jgi:hypothetical protein